MAAGKGYRVCGPAVVLRLTAGSERYLYRDAPVGEGYTQESLDRAIANGLVEEFEIPEKAVTLSPEEQYNLLTVPDLKTEIEKRNDGREEADKVSDKGNKPDLVAALLEDDAKQSAKGA